MMYQSPLSLLSEYDVSNKCHILKLKILYIESYTGYIRNSDWWFINYREMYNEHKRTCLRCFKSND